MGGQGRLNIWTYGQYHALQTQAIGYGKTYGQKIHELEMRNGKGPHTINTANVGSTRDFGWIVGSGQINLL